MGEESRKLLCGLALRVSEWADLSHWCLILLYRIARKKLLGLADST